MRTYAFGIVIFAFFSNSSQTQASTACALGFSDIAAMVNDENYDYIFLRYRSLPPEDAQYLMNHRAALLEVFAPWFQSLDQESNTVGSYASMLQDYHRMACTGKDGKSPYKISHSSGYRSSMDPVVAQGVFWRGLGTYTLMRSLRLRADEMKNLKAMTRNQEAHQNRQKFLRLLSDYFYESTVTRFFNFVNNSIIMAQVNYLLMVNGYEPREHGKLDFAVFIGDSEEFFRDFLYWLQIEL